MAVFKWTWLSSRRAGVAILLFLVLLVGLGNLWATYAYVGDFKAQIKSQNDKAARTAATVKAQQKTQNAAFLRRLCSSLEPLTGLSQLRPPSGNPRDNPSRAYEQQLSAKLAPLAQLGPDLGCDKIGGK